MHQREPLKALAATKDAWSAFVSLSKSFTAPVRIIAAMRRFCDATNHAIETLNDSPDLAPEFCCGRASFAQRRLSGRGDGDIGGSYKAPHHDFWTEGRLHDAAIVLPTIVANRVLVALHGQRSSKRRTD